MKLAAAVLLLILPAAAAEPKEATLRVDCGKVACSIAREDLEALLAANSAIVGRLQSAEAELAKLKNGCAARLEVVPHKRIVWRRG